MIPMTEFQFIELSFFAPRLLAQKCLILKRILLRNSNLNLITCICLRHFAMNLLYPLLRNISRLLLLFIPDEIWAKSKSSLKNYINRNESHNCHKKITITNKQKEAKFHFIYTKFIYFTLKVTLHHDTLLRILCKLPQLQSKFELNF